MSNISTRINLNSNFLNLKKIETKEVRPRGLTANDTCRKNDIRI